MSQKYEYQVHLDYEFHHPVEDVWKYVSNTDRINRMLRLPPVKYEFQPRPEGGTHLVGSFRVKGLLIRWKEHPYEWVKDQYFKIERDYLSGPIKYIGIQWRFEKTASGCKLRQTFTYRLLHPIFKPLAVLQIEREGRNGFLRCYGVIARHLDKKLRGEISEAFPVESRKLHSVDGKKRKLFKERLRQSQLSEETSDRLLDFLFTAQEHDVAEIRPFRVARKLGLDRVESVRVFLKAAQAGLVSISWNVLCPRCRGTQARGAVLSRLKSDVHCKSCNIQLSSDFSQSVELVFIPQENLRKASVQGFCAGSPRNTAHFHVQQRIHRDQDIRFKVKLSAGSYKLKSLQFPFETKLKVAESGATSVAFGSHSQKENLSFDVKEGDCEIVLKNSNDFEAVVVLEREAWLDDVCTAAFASALPDFRNIFAAQILDLGERVEFKSVAILFTDLKGSTELYRKIGDADAFFLIQQHFGILQKLIHENEGVVVKTIGDAVMAVFSRPENAVKAGLQMQEVKLGGGLQIKIAVHSGPCFVFRLNDVLDYFGSTVNLAARLQSYSEEGELLISGRMIDDPAVRTELKRGRRQAQQSTQAFKGFEEELEIYTIQAPSKATQAA